MSSPRYPGEAFATTESFPAPTDEHESSANGSSPDYEDETRPRTSFGVPGAGPAGGFEPHPVASSPPPPNDLFGAPTLAGPAAPPPFDDGPPPVLDKAYQPLFEQEISLSGPLDGYGDPTMDIGAAPPPGLPPGGIGAPGGMGPSMGPPPGIAQPPGMALPPGMGPPPGMAPPSGPVRAPVGPPQGPPPGFAPLAGQQAGRRGPRARGPRRAKLQLRHINPWTVLKFSCVLSVALFFVWLITIGLLYGILQAAGVIDHINDAVTTINGTTSKRPITPGLVFGGSAIIGVINMVLFIALSTVGSVVYNLCADLVGGVEVTLSERE
jgi:hypothetical protein